MMSGWDNNVNGAKNIVEFEKNSDLNISKFSSVN